jgi:uncharacterized protein
MNLVLVARSEDKLRQLSQQLSEQHGIRADVVPADLCLEGAVQEVYRRRKHWVFRLICWWNNAGFGTYGGFDTLALEREHEEIMLNVTALVDLAHAFVPAMAERKAGGIINVASIAAFQPLPYHAVYAASKAFMLSFSLALRAEYREQGVRVIALCPGTTATNFFTVLEAPEMPVMGRRHTPEAVVMAGLRALEQGRPYAVEGQRNAFGAQLTHMTPLPLTTRVFARVMHPRKQEAAPGGERAVMPLASQSRP